MQIEQIIYINLKKLNIFEMSVDIVTFCNNIDL